ncbi:MAG TPA: hypothetical protein VNY74_08910 [Edaphobacter sp.]|nr:hypothetical protein [Edaphobacter sp.]
MDFIGRDAISAIGEHPQSAKPLVQTERGVFEDSSDFEGELLLAIPAIPELSSWHKVVVVGLAAWTRHLTVWPAKVLRILKAAVGIAEENDGFLQCVRRFHTSNSKENSTVCQVYYVQYF